MNKATFDAYYRNLLRKASAKRAEKEAEYFSEDDLISNFRRIAAFRDKETPETIMDLGSKQLQSISDMVNYQFGYMPLPDESYTLEEWDEKFVDAVNYLLKLYAAIREQQKI